MWFKYTWASLTLPTLASQKASVCISMKLALHHSPATPLPTLISCFLLHLETGNESMGLFVRSWLSGKNKILTRNLRVFFHNSISHSIGTSTLSMTFLPFTISHYIPFLTMYRLSPSTCIMQTVACQHWRCRRWQKMCYLLITTSTEEPKHCLLSGHMQGKVE